MQFLEELNPSQYEAATHIDGSLLILAGAGSGKTKTITARLAYLLSLGIDPKSTLTLTFTNKAATEMKERALKLIDVTYPPLLSTFHKFGLLFLKMNIHLLNRKNSFVIIDTDDKRRIIKNISQEIHQNIVAKEISKYKNNFLTPDEIFALAKDNESKKIAHIYQEYIKYLDKNNLLDFDDLLLLTYKILDEYEEVATSYSQKYQYIMVDEYQDTNDIQLKILKKLCSTHNNICVVGDDDQSIYGFRGANIKNILEFQKEFDAKIVKLEHNYRSTPEILDVANKLISFNKNRHTKILKPTIPNHKKVEVVENYNEMAEAQMLANRINELISKGVNPNNIAILYRINALSRGVEDGLRGSGINYKLVGGIKFYEREEIKDIISYLRLLVNKNDDYSFKRIVNKPRRGIGKTSLDKLENAKNDKSFMQLLEEDISFVSKKAQKSLKEFKSLIEELSQMKLIDLVYSLDRLGLVEFYKDEDKIQNLNEFYGLLKEFAKKGFTLEEVLNELSLQSDADAIEDNAINIMTIHASKGLEFDYLFVIGLEEGFFPLNDADIEEERRLAYVALTRAKKELVLSYAKSRYIRGNREFLDKSRFLMEMGLVNEKAVKKEAKTTKANDLVKHKVFGIGKVIGSTKVGKQYKLKINFGGDIREILDNFVEKI